MTFVRILVWWAINLLGLWVAAELVEGIAYDGFWCLVLAALVFGLINLVLRPILILLTLPAVILTLGILILFINAFLLWLTGAIFGDKFEVVDFFWAAILGAIVIWAVNMVLVAAPPAAHGAAGRHHSDRARRLRPLVADRRDERGEHRRVDGQRVQPLGHEPTRLLGELARPVEPVERRVRDLPRRLVLPGRLAQLGGGAGGVEDVVHDLEQEPELGPERRPRLALAPRRARRRRSPSGSPPGSASRS